MKNISYIDFETPVENHNTIPWASANGYCLNNKKEVCIVWEEEKGVWNLPGGGKEVGETPEQTFRREVEEETQCIPSNIKYLHSVYARCFEDVNNETAYTEDPRCFRFICTLENIEPFIPRKNGMEIDERKFVSIDELPQYIPWLENSENGRESFRAFKGCI